MQFKALAIDLDGTLLVGEKIPQTTLSRCARRATPG